MKQTLALFCAIATIAASTTVALADDHHQDQHGGHGRPYQRHANYHEGQVYHGHHLHQYHGHWGYYQPRNGTNVFISIPL